MRTRLVIPLASRPNLFSFGAIILGLLSSGVTVIDSATGVPGVKAWSDSHLSTPAGESPWWLWWWKSVQSPNEPQVPGFVGHVLRHVQVGLDPLA